MNAIRIFSTLMVKKVCLMKLEETDEKISKSITRKNFESFLEKQDLKKKEEKGQIDWNERKKDWLRHIGEFYQIVQGFLKEYLEQGKVSINPKPLTLNEEHIGSYETEKCHLRMGSQEVVFSPVGTRMIGSRGRIDMEGRAGKVILLLVDKESEGISVKTRIYAGGEAPKEKDAEKKEIIWTWKIATPPPLLRYVDKDRRIGKDILSDPAFLFGSKIQNRLPEKMLQEGKR